MVAAAVVALAVGAGAWFGTRGGAELPPLAIADGPVVEMATTPGDELVVHVSGWVAVPGLVRVPDGSRVADVVAAAGGARTGAVLAGMNLAEPVRDGQQVVVPGPEAVAAAGAGAGGVTSDGRVRVNDAEAAELEDLPGVGPVLASRIVEHREHNGPFEAVEDLLDVPGIGERKLASLRDSIVVP